MNRDQFIETSKQIGYLFCQGRLIPKIEITNVILEHAPNLFTPKSFLLDVLEKINTTISGPIIYSLKEILQICGNQLKNKQKFNKCLKHVIKQKQDFALAIVYSYPDAESLKENLINFSYTKQQSVINIFQQNPLMPGNTFDNLGFKNNDTVLIVLNRNVIKTDFQLEQKLNHQLEHYFDRFGNFNEQTNQIEHELIFDKDINNILNNKKYKPILKLLEDIGYLDWNDYLNVNDTIQHFFTQNEFFPMLSSVSNILGYYLKQKKWSIKQKINFILNKINQSFIRSDSFQKQTLEIQMSILFLYVNKQISKQRFDLIIQKINDQFKENEKDYSFFIKAKNRLKDLFKSNK